jgi:O-antigen ligase
MAPLLSLFACYLMAVQAFALDIGLGPGLSLKNGILYLFFAFLLMRFAVQRDFRLELGGIWASFAALLTYAVLSTVAIVMFVQYPGYKLMTAITQFKGLPFDFMAMLFVFFYGTKTRRDTQRVLDAVLFTAVFANVVSALDATGIMPLATINDGETADRVQGVMSEHNQYGAYLAFFCPLLLAATLVNQGIRRAFWLAGTLVSFAVLLMTVSRGAFVALALAGIVGAFRFRKHLMNPKVIGYLVGGGVIGVLLIVGVLFGTSFGSTLIERLLGQSTQIDMWQVSSGRSELWADAVGQMMRTPITMLTGFGWATYFVLPSALPLAPHNTYLWYWFELGLIGVIAFTAIIVQLITQAARAAENTTNFGDRAYFMAFTIGTAALAFAIFFVEIYTPWPFVWAAAGCILRLAVIGRDEQRASARAPAVQDAAAPPAANPDRFGWKTATVRRTRAERPI